MSELKPCPFCGKSDIHIEQKGTFFWCECYDCGAISREHHTLPGVNVLQSEDIARRYWNQRPIEDALTARIAELEAALNIDAELTIAGLRKELSDIHKMFEIPKRYADLWHERDWLSQKLTFAVKVIAELEAAQRWHVVADGDLPIFGKSIMFYDSSSEEIYRGVYTASHHWRANYFSEKCGTVTHWMPLPTPPEVQE